jgi:hypothetical protein
MLWKQITSQLKQEKVSFLKISANVTNNRCCKQYMVQALVYQIEGHALLMAYKKQGTKIYIMRNNKSSIKKSNP